MGLSYILFGKFDIQLKGKIHSKKCFIQQDWNLCSVHLMLLLAQRFSFALVCLPVSISCALTYDLGNKKILFCLFRTSENGILEEDPSVLPRVWVMLLLGDIVVSEKCIHPSFRECKICKSDRYGYSFEYIFSTLAFFAEECNAKSLFCLRACEQLSSTYFCETRAWQCLTLQTLTILGHVIPLTSHHIRYLACISYVIKNLIKKSHKYK